MRTLIALTRTELRLLTREWAAMLFAFAFPALMLVVLAGVFGDLPDPEGFGAAIPSEHYVASYIAIPLGALALVGLPVMLASYRERDVLRRFAAFGVPAGAVVAAQALVSALLVLAGVAVVLLVAAPTYGIPTPADPVTVVAGFVLGTVTMLAIGVALGLAASTARAAQAIGLLAFFPMWLLGGGPPQRVMSGAMVSVADVLPLTHAISAVRDPWLFEGAATGADLLALGVWLTGALVVVGMLLRRRPQ